MVIIDVYFDVAMIWSKWKRHHIIEYKMIISHIYRDGKDCGQIGDRMSDNDEKLTCLH